MPDSVNEKLKVVGVFNLFPHYREAIYKCLWDNSEIEFTICAGINSKNPSLKIHSSESLKTFVKNGQFIPLKNYWFGKRFLWQAKVAWPGFYHRYDVIIHDGSVYQLSTWLALFWIKLMGKRSLLWTHGVLEREKGVKGLIRYIFYRLSDGLLLYGNRAKHLLEGSGFESNSLYVVYNSLDYKTQKKNRNSINIKKIKSTKKNIFKYMELPLLIFVGRMTAEKHPLMLVDLALIMKNSNNPVNIIIIGDGPELVSLKRKVISYKLKDFVYIHGSCYDEEVLATMMCAADLAVLPGYVGLSAMHYMAYGLPVLTSNDSKKQKPEVEAIVKGKTGDFYLHGNINSLITKVTEWIGKIGPETRENCINQIEQYYNPEVQRTIINYACKGLPANQQPYSNNF